MKVLNFLLVLIILASLATCNEAKTEKKKEDDTLSTGTIRVSVDESLKPLMEAEFNVFGYQYPNAHLIISYKPETEVFNDFKNDSARAIIVTRELSSGEMDYFRSIQYIPVSLAFARDGISIIVNHKNTPDSFTVSELKTILSGKSNQNLMVVFDNTASSTLRWLKDSLLKKEPLGKNCFALHTNSDVIDYVSNHENVIGIIGTSWISDLDDTLVRNRLKSVKRASIAAEGSKEYLEPYQSEIKTERYALARTIYSIQRDGKLGLGSGLQHFLYSEKGQFIVLKFGMLPYNQPERSIRLKL